MKTRRLNIRVDEATYKLLQELKLACYLHSDSEVVRKALGESFAANRSAVRTARRVGGYQARLAQLMEVDP